MTAAERLQRKQTDRVNRMCVRAMRVPPKTPTRIWAYVLYYYYYYYYYYCVLNRSTPARGIWSEGHPFFTPSPSVAFAVDDVLYYNII